MLVASEIYGCTIGGLAFSRQLSESVARDKFVVQVDVDLTDKASGKGAKMSELGTSTVKKGTIVREEFLPNVANAG